MSASSFLSSNGLASSRRRLAALVGIGAVLALLIVLSETSAHAAVPASFGSLGSGAGQFKEPFGIAVEQQSGDVYIYDKGNARVDKFNSQGEFLLAFGWGVADGAAESQACGPESIPLSPTCRSGLAGSGTGQFSAESEAIAVDNSGTATQGDLYVTERGNSRIQRFGPDGAFQLMIGGEVNAAGGSLCVAGEECRQGVPGPGAGEFDALEGLSIAVGPTGTLYVGGGFERLQEFEPSGSFKSEIPLPSGFGYAKGLAVDSSADIYAVLSGVDGVCKFDDAGTELGTPRDPTADPSSTAIAIGEADQLVVTDLVVADPTASSIETFDPSGKQTSSLPSGVEARGIAWAQTVERTYDLRRESVQVQALPSNGVPLVLTRIPAAIEIQPTTVTLNAAINPEGGEETSYSFEYGTTTTYGETIAGASPLEPVNEIQTVVVKANAGSYLLRIKGESTVEIPFAAEATEVQADLEALASIGAGGVFASGPAGGPYAVEFTGGLGAADQPQIEAESVSLKETTFVEGEERIKAGNVSVTTTAQGADLFDTRPVTASVINLLPRTTYHFRVLAENKAGETAVGPDQSFETLPPVSIESTSATQISATSAVLETELNPHGLLSNYHFEYDTTPYTEGGAPHGTATATGSVGSTTTTVHRSASIGALLPGTAYHFRVVAENSLGTVDGPDRSFTTEGPAGSALPDGRAWEMVSPPDKNGVPLEALSENGGVIQSAADGSGLAFIAKGAISAAAPGTRSFAVSQLLARRERAGWSTEDVTTPNEAERGLTAGSLGEYKLFSTDLSLGAVQPEGGTPLSPATSERTPYLRLPDGTYVPLVVGCPAAPRPCPTAVQEQANVPAGTVFGGTEAEGPEVFQRGVDLLDASPDLAHLILTTPAALTGGSPGSGPLGLYEWSSDALQPLSLIPTGSAITCGGTGPPCLPTAEEGLDSFLGHSDQQMRHAFSDDGDRAIFETPGAGTAHLYVRDPARRETLMLDATEAGAPGGGTPAFQTANADGSRVFFTDDAPLTASATPSSENPDLYMCQIGEAAGRLSCTLTDLSANGVNPAEPADVQGAVIGAAEDGSSVYFVAQGALTEGEGAVHGSCFAKEGQCNLYRYDVADRSLTLIAVLSGADRNDWLGAGGIGKNLSELTARVSPDGHWLAFMSERPLTGYDNRDAVSGERDQEVFLYHAGPGGEAGILRCASCNPTGARPDGLLESPQPPFPLVDRLQNWQNQRLAASIPGWTRVTKDYALYQPRYLSDSGRLFFNSFDALVPQDSNGTEDVYEYEPPGVGNCTESSSNFGRASGGCVGLISSGESGQESAFLDASESGDDVFFLTASQLVRKDVDTALDVYDAHACSASSPCPAAEEARSPECDGDACQQPAVPPAHPTPGTSLLNGPGNVLQCPKGKVKQKGKCVKKKQKKAKKHHKKKGKHKKSDKKNGGGKKQKRATGHNRGGHK